MLPKGEYWGRRGRLSRIQHRTDELLGLLWPQFVSPVPRLQGVVLRGFAPLGLAAWGVC